MDWRSEEYETDGHFIFFLECRNITVSLNQLALYIIIFQLDGILDSSSFFWSEQVEHLPIIFRSEDIPERNTGQSKGNGKREDPLEAAIDLGEMQSITIAGYAVIVR
jgi:hypothetical protein